MSHGSQRALVLTVNLEMKTTGEHTTTIDRPSLATTLANTHPKHLNRLLNQGEKFWFERNVIGGRI